MVYIINSNGQPLMPMENHAKVRILLKNKGSVSCKKLQLIQPNSNYLIEYRKYTV